MPSAQEILDRHHITGVDPHSSGRTYTKCPKCSADRTGYNRHAKCLAVNINNDGVRFFCNHCDKMKGGEFFEAPQGTARPNGTGYQPRPGGLGVRAMPTGPRNGYEAMHKAARTNWRRS